MKTVIDYDKILVLGMFSSLYNTFVDEYASIDKGQVVEFGSPFDLMVNSKIGMFRSMCEETGHVEELLKIASAGRTFSN